MLFVPAERANDRARARLRAVARGAALVAVVAWWVAVPLVALYQLGLPASALGDGSTWSALAVAEYQKVAASVQGERVATVRSARPLDEGDQDRLRTALGRQYGRDIHLNLVVQPELIGGMRVEIGDDVIDGSVASRLDDARRKLAG